MSAVHYIELETLRGQINAIVLEYPDLADDEALRIDTLEGETRLFDVLERLAAAALDAGTMAEAIKLRMSAQAERKARFERKEEGYRNLILDLMSRADVQKVPLPDATLSITNRKPSPYVADESALPEHCVRIERKPDMEAIRAEIDAGHDVPGVAMNNGGRSLAIRSK